MSCKQGSDRAQILPVSLERMNQAVIRLQQMEDRGAFVPGRTVHVLAEFSCLKNNEQGVRVLSSVFGI